MGRRKNEDVSDEQNPPLTGDVHDVTETALVRQEHGGAIAVGNIQPQQPTPADVRDSLRKKLYQVIPELNRIAQNKEDKRKKAKPGPYKTADQLRAIDIMMRGATDDTISVSDFRRAMKGFSEDIMRAFPGETGERILNIAAPWFFPL